MNIIVDVPFREAADGRKTTAPIPYERENAAATQAAAMISARDRRDDAADIRARKLEQRGIWL